MNAKTILTVVLVIFALAAIVVAIVKTANDASAPADQPAKIMTTQPASDASEKIIVYYFHRNKRCRTCQTIESYTHETVQQYFQAELENGDVEWKVLNYEKPENRYYADRFQLAAASVIIAKVRGDEVLRWDNMVDIWTLVRDKPAFMDYIKSAITDLQEDEE